MHSLLLIAVAGIFVLAACGEHVPVDDINDTNGDPEFGEEEFFGGYFYYDNGVQVFLMRSSRLISVLFNPNLSDDDLRQVAEQFDLLSFPELSPPDEIEWGEIKHNVTLWVVPEDAVISDYYTVYPRGEDSTDLFGIHPFVIYSQPSFVDSEIMDRYFITDFFNAVAFEDIDRDDLEELNEFYGVEIVSETPQNGEILFELQITKDARFNTLQTANAYITEIMFTASYPHFITMPY